MARRTRPVWAVVAGVYALFACWQLLGIWERIAQALVQAADAGGKLG